MSYSYPDVIFIPGSGSPTAGQNVGDMLAMSPKAGNQLQLLRTDHRQIKDSGSYDYNFYNNRFAFPIVNIIVN